MTETDPSAPQEPSADPSLASDAERLTRQLREHLAGTLSDGDRSDRVRFIVEPARGTLVLPAPSWLTPESEEARESGGGIGTDGAASLTLFIPEESFHAWQCQVEAAGWPDTDSSETDRWRAHHGRGSATRWVELRVGGAKEPGGFVEAGTINLVNPIAHEESAACRALNADRDLIARALPSNAKAGEGVQEQPVVVGVDARGATVRLGSWRSVRLVWIEPIAGADEAPAALARLAEGASR